MRSILRVAILCGMLVVLTSCGSSAKEVSAADLRVLLTSLAVPAGATLDSDTEDTGVCTTVVQKYSFSGRASDVQTFYRESTQREGWQPVLADLGEEGSTNETSYLRDQEAGPLFLRVSTSANAFELLIRSTEEGQSC